MIKIVFALLLASPFALAAIDDEPPIRKGAMINVQAWDAKSKTYDIEMEKYPAQGPNYATVANLLAAVKTLDAAKVKKHPDSIVGNSYQLDAELKLESVIKIQKLRAGKSGAKTK